MRCIVYQACRKEKQYCVERGIMRKHWILGASAIILASSVMACGKKQETATTAAGSEKAMESTAAQAEKSDYVFVKMTVPYADFTTEN